MRYLLTFILCCAAGNVFSQAAFRPIAKDATDQSVVIRIVDSTDGTPETGVEHNTSGIDLEYRREGAASVDITEAALAALTTAHTDGGIEHIGNGYYRLDVPDAAFATGVPGVLIHGTVTDMVVIGAYVPLVDSITVNASGQVTVGDFATGAIDADAIAADAIGSSELAATAIAEIWNATLATYSGTAGSVAEKISKIIEVGTQYRYTNQDDGGTPAAADDVTITVP